MKVILTMFLWNTWKWFQNWFCEIHESDFSIGVVKYMKVISTLVLFSGDQPVCEIHETDFSIGLVKYMKVISTMFLWNTWKWFQNWFCEIHESDFSIGLVFQVTNLFVKYMKDFCEIHKSDFNIDFYEIHESDFSIGLVKYMKVISPWASGLMKTSKWIHTCMVEI
jgi:hypothetical protein